jgi:pantoate--beta-alanine ligase
MKIFRTIQDYRAWRADEKSRIGFVPTMGALHDGHASLLHASRDQGLKTVLSIFVNPTQFGPNEDFSKYPRTEEKDLEIAKVAGVDAVFLPSVEEMYPENYSTYIEETRLSVPLCGKFRPGHFRGVTTIVYRLFQIIQPSKAFFGLKDLQQFLVLKKMVEDLNLPLTLEGVPTLREPDGLALSSRNRYLSTEDRLRAASIYRNLTALCDRTATFESAWQDLEKQGFKVQYLEERNTADLSPASGEEKESAIFFAGFLNQTRLIDNVIRRKPNL